MNTAYYISPTDQATASDGSVAEVILLSQGFRRVSFIRWLWMCLFVIKQGDYYAHFVKD